MSKASLKNALRNFGATEKEAEIYIFLAKRGALKTGQIAKQMKINKGLVYRVLSSLKQKGLVETTLEFPIRFTAVSLEKVIDSYVKTKREEVALVEKTKQDLLRDWERISKTEIELPLEKFSVLEGSKKIYRKIAEMMEKTQKSFSAASTVAGLARAEQCGAFDAAYAHPIKSKVEFRFLTKLNQQNLKAFKLLKAKFTAGVDIKAIDPDLGLASFPRMVIRDNEEILLFILPKKDLPTKKEEVCVNTNCGSIVQSFTGVFEDLWRNSTTVEEKIAELETGKLIPKTLILSDEETAKEKYFGTLRDAEKEALILTSEEGLIRLSENAILRELARQQVSVSIMAPITNQNLRSAEQLLEYCKVRHVNKNYTPGLETTIVDDKHFFRFKGSSGDSKESDISFSFENVFYSTDATYVEKTKKLMEGLWITSFDLSKSKVLQIQMLQKSNGRLYPKKDTRKLSERLSEFKRPSVGIISATHGETIITPPSYLKMPDIKISAVNFDEESSLGGGNLLSVDVWLKTPKGEAFVPVAFAMNVCPEAAAISKAKYEGTPAGENIIQVKPEELRVWKQGTTLFAFWTIPIPLLTTKFKLEPAFVMFEAFGDELHMKFSNPLPSGYVEEVEWTGFQAFTTFIAPSWRFSGPGTSGWVGNLIMIDAAPEK